MWIILASITASSCLSLNTVESSGQVVTTTSGTIRGTFRTTTTGSVNAFLGVPFAEPPIGELRFKKPVPKKPWEGVLNTTAWPPLCPQRPTNLNDYFRVTEADPMSEDCLFLNVFVPTRNHSEPMPIVVYIHGGGFAYAGISLKIYDPSELVARGGLVVVVAAYRLGALGFLYMDMEDAPGNMGLYDQLLALRWVRDNARAFGGDADMVTIMGQSAGSISVGIHLISPKSGGLFRRAIMQSGSPFSPHVIMNKTQAARKANAIVTYLNCNKGQYGSGKLGIKGVVACLRSKDFRDLLEATESFNLMGTDGFFPLSGDEFLPEKPRALLARVKRNAHEVLVSTCESEGDLFVYYLLTKFVTLSDIGHFTKRHAELFTRFVLTIMTSADPKKIFEHYFEHMIADSGREVAHSASDIVGDLLLLCPTLRFAEGLSTGQNMSVYAFEFSHRPSFAGWPEWTRPTHGDDIFFTLGSALSMNVNLSEADVRVTENLVNVISTFSRTGVPRVINGTEWPLFNEDQQYLHIRDGPAVLAKHLRQTSCNFANRTVPDE